MKEEKFTNKPSEPDKVNAFIKNMKHPLGNIVEALRHLILETDPEIGEQVKWNAPGFFYAGQMRPSDPTEYRRYRVVFNLFKQDCIRLVFPAGAKVDDKTGFLTGDYADGRRLALFYNIEDVEKKKEELQRVISRWLQALDKGTK